MQQARIVFIGGGNMATSLIGGLLADGLPASQLTVVDTDPAQRSACAQRFAIAVEASALPAVASADVVVLAVKPNQIQSVVHSLRDALPADSLLLSIAAGIPLEALERWMGRETAIVRAMPNTPALVQAGVSALIANSQTRPAQRELAEALLRAVGMAIWLEDEVQMDAVTAVSGSGPAYFFLVMEAIESAARTLGLPADTAHLLCLETAFGAAKMALESAQSPAQLREAVTSKGGTTERALHELEDGGLRGLFENALVAAALRSRELAEALGQADA